jgi:hypothetical protein
VHRHWGLLLLQLERQHLALVGADISHLFAVPDERLSTTASKTFRD